MAVLAVPRLEDPGGRHVGSGGAGAQARAPRASAASGDRAAHRQRPLPAAGTRRQTLPRRLSASPTAMGWRPWGVATCNLKTLACGHHTLCLSLHPQPGEEHSYDDRPGRIDACLSMGQAGARRSAHPCRGHGRVGGAVSPGRAPRPLRRTGPCLAG